MLTVCHRLKKTLTFLATPKIWAGKLSLSVKHLSSKKAEEPAEVLAPYVSDWKNYYEILRVTPKARPKAITVAYNRLSRFYQTELSDAVKQSPSFLKLINDINEAYQVLSNPVRRHAYDQLFATKHGSEGTALEAPMTRKIISLFDLVAKEASQTRKRHFMPLRGIRGLPRPTLIGLILLVLVFVLGTSFAIARPAHAMSKPFHWPATAVLRASSGAITLIEDIRGITARYERNVVQTSVQSMRVVENLKDVPAVSIPTNDMACFPSTEYPLFPKFLDRRHSQFRYTVSSDGIVTVDTSTATTDHLQEKIKQLLAELEE